MGAKYNEPQFNAAQFNAGAGTDVPSLPDTGDFASPLSCRDRYILEVQNPAQATQAFLQDAIDVAWEQTINEPSLITFKYPAANDQAEYITLPNVVVLRDKDGALLDSCLIAQQSTKRDDDGALTMTVHCEGYMSVLGKTVVEEYDSEGKTAGAIIADLLNLQPSDSPWAKVEMGNVSAGVRTRVVPFTATNRTILQSLRSLRDLIGGYFVVRFNSTGQPRFYWDMLYNTLYMNRQIIAGRNCPWLTVNKDYRTIRTKVIAYGAGASPETRIKSEQVASATVLSTYGTISTVVSEPSIEEQDTLDEYASMILAELQQPRIQYYIGAIELSEVDTSWDWVNETLSLGDGVRIHDEHLDVTLGTAITRIRRNLQGQCSIEVSDPDAGDSDKGLSTKRSKPADLIDEIVALKEKLDDITKGDPGYIDAIADYVLDEIDIGDFDFPWDDVNQAISDAIDDITVPQPGDNIQSVGEANEGGSSVAYAREDHVHEGAEGGGGMEFAEAATKPELPSESAPYLGFTTSNNYYYARVGSKWLCISHLEVPS